MEKKMKKEIVKMLLKSNLESVDENELIEMLIDQPISIDVDKEDKKDMKLGDRVADAMTKVAGSWGFILIFLFFLIIWIIINIIGLSTLDPFPFILLNLVLSCIAALQAPIIMMSQNRHTKKDSIRNQNDYRTDLKSELILEELHEHMELMIKNQKKIISMLNVQDNDK